MRKFTDLIFITINVVLVFCTCTSLGSVTDKSASTQISRQDKPFDSDHWYTLPGQNNLIVIGISARQNDPKMEIEFAREDAARKIAMYYGVRVVYESIEDIGSGFLEYYVASQISIDHDLELEKYMEKLTYNPQRDLVDNGDVIYIRFSYPAAFPGSLNFSSEKKPDGRPEWTTHRPQNIGNFLAGVGYSGRQVKVKDTFFKSGESAAANIVSQISTSIENKISSNSMIYQNREVVSRKSEGKLNNFLVIETWTDPETLGVWTLAVAQAIN